MVEEPPTDEAPPVETAEPLYAHSYVVETVAADSEHLITVVVDDAYLTDEARVWPVAVDPSFDFNRAASAINDAILYNGASAQNTAHGSNWDHYIAIITALMASVGFSSSSPA